MRKLTPVSELRRSTAYSAAAKRMGQAEELARGGSIGTADVALAQARKFGAYAKGGRGGYRKEADKQSTRTMVHPDRTHPRPLMWKRGAIRTGTGEGPIRTAHQPGPAGAQIKRRLKSISGEEEKANEARVLKPKKKEKDTNPTTKNLPEPSKKDKFTNPFVPSNEGKMSDLDIKAQEGDKKAKRKLIKISFDAGIAPDTPKKKLSEQRLPFPKRGLRSTVRPTPAIQASAERRKAAGTGQTQQTFKFQARPEMVARAKDRKGRQGLLRKGPSIQGLNPVGDDPRSPGFARNRPEKPNPEGEGRVADVPAQGAEATGRAGRYADLQRRKMRAGAPARREHEKFKPETDAEGNEIEGTGKSFLGMPLAPYAKVAQREMEKMEREKYFGGTKTKAGTFERGKFSTPNVPHPEAFKAAVAAQRRRATRNM